MPRNRTKNVYITVGFPRGSEVLHRLEEESRQSGTSIAKLIPVKLLELYGGSTRPSLPLYEQVPKPRGAESNALAFLESEDE